MPKYKLFFDLESLSSYSSISLFLSLESSLWNSTLHFLLPFLSLSFTLKELQPEVTNNLCKCHLFSKTFPNPSTYNTNLMQFKKQQVASLPGTLIPLSWLICLHSTYKLLTCHAIHFPILSFAPLDKNVSSVRAGVFVYLVNAKILMLINICTVNQWACTIWVLTYCTSETSDAVFASFVFSFFSHPLATVTPSPRFPSFLWWLLAHSLGCPFLHPHVNDQYIPRIPYLISFSSLSLLNFDDMWQTARKAFCALTHITLNLRSTYLSSIFHFYKLRKLRHRDILILSRAMKQVNGR